MTGGSPRRAVGVALTLAVVGSLAVGCALGADQAGRDARNVLAPTTTTAPPTTPTTQPPCDRDAVTPVPPLPPAGTPFTTPALRKIQNTKLVVGVDQNSLGLSAFNPADQTFSGLEIDLLKRVAEEIFGPGGESRIEYRVILSSQREDAIRNGTVDIVADAVTKTCARLSGFNFTNTYLTARQRLLVRSDSNVTSIADLSGKTVCATKGTTTLARLADFPDVKPFPVDARTDCLVALQQGQVDAVTSDDTILQGFQHQDPHTMIVGGCLEPEPYGMLVGVAGQNQDVADLVNGVLARMQQDGTLDTLIGAHLPSDLTHPGPGQECP